MNTTELLLLAGIAVFALGKKTPDAKVEKETSNVVNDLLNQTPNLGATPSATLGAVTYTVDTTGVHLIPSNELKNSVIYIEPGTTATTTKAVLPVTPEIVPTTGNTVLTFDQVMLGATSSKQYSSIPSAGAIKQMAKEKSGTQRGGDVSVTVGNTTIYRDNEGKPVYVRG